jgi:hypothetical protein
LGDYAMAVAREWWVEYARGLPNMNASLIDHPEAMVQDGTATLEELNHMTGNLREVGWADFQDIWEKHCPAGQNVHGKKGPFIEQQGYLFMCMTAWWGILQQIEWLTHTTNICRLVKKCWKFINSHGGFMVCRSITRGNCRMQVVPMQKIVSEQVSYHVCYLQPSQLNIFNSDE